MRVMSRCISVFANNSSEAREVRLSPPQRCTVAIKEALTFFLRRRRIAVKLCFASTARAQEWPGKMARATVPSSGCCAVIGGSGFIGRHIVDACLREFDAVVIVDLHAPADACRAEVRLADMCDPDQLSLALRGAAAVIHAAGVVDTRSGPWHDERIHRLNVDGTAAVIEACRRAHVEALVYVSSHSAASDGVWGDNHGALHGEGKASAYGRSKQAADYVEQPPRGFEIELRGGLKPRPASARLG